MKLTDAMRGFYFVISVMASLTLIFGVLGYVVYVLMEMV